MSEINLGDEVKDIITGFEGVVIARQEGLFETTSCKVQQRGVNDDHRPFEPIWFEESRLERQCKSAVVPKEELDEAGKSQG